jgi:hypothetical protein
VRQLVVQESLILFTYRGNFRLHIRNVNGDERENWKEEEEEKEKKEKKKTGHLILVHK